MSLETGAGKKDDSRRKHTEVMDLAVTSHLNA